MLNFLIKYFFIYIYIFNKKQINYTDGSGYIGNLSDDERNGYGIYYYVNGDIYCGVWKQNLFDGDGIYLY